MHLRSARRVWRCHCCLVAGLALAFCWDFFAAGQAGASEKRRTALVEAVQQARPSIVNIHGEKFVAGQVNPLAPGDNQRRVNGMGTGVVIDERGYILTNFHVVDGVQKIMVTTAQRETHVAQLVSHDPKTDLALIKIEASEELPIINIGTSDDLMPGETVVAVGNAFGYEYTVTQGIISALHRSVQVSEAQDYENLIQTDASINPGNSGGPLLNIDGEMIGINVAVRAGAQGIGFAIPIDDALRVATELLSTRRVSQTWHGMIAALQKDSQEPGVVVQEIDLESPAAASGLLSGDVVTKVGGTVVHRPLDVERALLDHASGDVVEVAIQRDHQSKSLQLKLVAAPKVHNELGDRVWEALGLRLEPVPDSEFRQYRSRYRGGLSVTNVRADGPAARQGIRRGDTLVGMHIWETISLDNVAYILNRPDFAALDPLKFYILRGNETLYGHLTVSSRRQP